MQTGRLQAEDGRYGFNLEAALTEIAAMDYYLFTGSIRLLGARVVARPTTLQGPINV
jgi:hypothetical protein